jgi:hypothetical protein
LFEASQTSTSSRFLVIIFVLVLYIACILSKMAVNKGDLELQLKDEHKMIQDGMIRDDSPLDVSDEFRRLCEACRIGDLKGCQESIVTGVNINARDSFDYTPLILVSRWTEFGSHRPFIQMQDSSMSQLQ